MIAPWIKFESTTPDKPEVIAMASILRKDPDLILGKLIRLWCWADQNSIAGDQITIPKAWIDRHLNLRGFAAAMVHVGWLEGDDLALSFPNFARHNGKSAKSRATSNRRVAKHRDQKGNADTVTDVTPTPLQKPLPEEEEEEEEDNVPHPYPPQGREGEGQEGKPDSLKLPKGWRKWPATRRKASRVSHNTPMMIRIGKCFGRKPERLWTIYEAGLLADIKPEEAEIELFEHYYLAIIDPDKDIRRRDLGTALNNWAGELDRAINWKNTPQP